MFKMLIDTCVWLDIAKDHTQKAVLGTVEELIKQGELVLLQPQTIVDEFARNKARVIEDSNRSLGSYLKRVKEAVDKLGDPKGKAAVMRHLDDVDHKLPSLSDTATRSVSRIEAIFAKSSVMPISDGVKLRASQRAIDGAAPFHRQKNSMNDAILIEVYADAVTTPSVRGTRFAFVTHNVKDFSLINGNNKLPHGDIANLFSKLRSLYFIQLGDALRRVAPEMLSEITFEHEWVEEPRRLTEIVEAIDEFCDKVWYDRHQQWRQRVAEGKDIIYPTGKPPLNVDHQRQTPKDIWDGARKAARRIEKKYGENNLGPWTKFEWGMINGKLSALRWVLGDEWDMLDT
jgi:hypothetical protein